MPAAACMDGKGTLCDMAFKASCGFEGRHAMHCFHDHDWQRNANVGSVSVSAPNDQRQSTQAKQHDAQQQVSSVGALAAHLGNLTHLVAASLAAQLC